MGEVYRAHDAKLGRDIALKMLPAELSENLEALRRFEQEARAASALNHPNIVTIYEINHSEAVAWIAMELVEGQDLRMLTAHGALSLKNALRIAVRIIDGLAAAHERGIVHRDLKPDNVMVTGEGFVKLLDFGLAKQARVISASDATVPHTTPGMVFGTVAYMSPEQAMGREMDYRSDQFSFGVMLYEMLTGQRPFEQETRPETMASIMRDEAVPPSVLNQAVPAELDRVILRCLKKDPRERYGSTRDLAHDLREIRDDLTHASNASHRSARPVPQVVAPRRPWIGLATGTVILVAAIGAMYWNRGRVPDDHVASVAVVPFRDLSATSEGRMLADGISEMIAARLSGVRELRVASPFDGAPVDERDDPRDIARRRGTDAVIHGSVQRDSGEIRVTYSVVDGESGRTVASGNTTAPASNLFALEDRVAEDLLRTLGRRAPVRPAASSVPLSAEGQKQFTEALGLLRRVQDEGSVDRAITTLEALLSDARESAPVNALLARALLFKASLARRPALIDQATVYASRAATLDSSDVDAQVTLGLLQSASGRHAEAMKTFDHALALRPDNAGALVGLADAYDNLGRSADAEAMYRKALALQPDATGALTGYGAFCYARGRYEQAAALFRRATQLAPKFSHAHANLGAALQALGKYDEAEASYRRSIDIQPTAAGWSNLGTLQFFVGRYGDARESYERAVALAPTDYVMWSNLGDACRLGGAALRADDAYAHAVAAARDALSVNSKDAPARASLALALARRADGDGAQEEIRRALELDPTSAGVLYKACVIAAIRGNDDAALSWLERAVAAGYPAREAARDPDLASIRKMPSFHDVIKQKS